MGGANSSLLLEIETEEGKSSFELNPNQSILIGRRAEAEVRLKRSSISQSHLQITWTGRELRVKDMGSSYGTVRLPEEAALSEESFPPVYAPLELRLAKSRVVISWRRKDFVAEPTEVVPGTVAAPEPLQLETDPAPRPAPLPRAQVAKPVAPAPSRSQASATSESRSSPEAAATSVALLALTGVSIVMTIAGAAACKGVKRAAPSLLKMGGIYDLLALWTHWLLSSKEIIFVFMATLLFLAHRFVRRAVAGQSPLANRLAPAFGWASSGYTFVLRVVGLVVLLAAFGWPYLLALRYGAPPKTWFRSVMLYQAAASRIDPNLNGETLQARTKQIKALAHEFPGSSLLYSALLKNQRQRVLTECGGVGEAPWDNKKVCLVLLFAVSVETREETHPALLQDISARVSILLSLDGITRVLAAEGAASPMIPFFLESLDLVGLGREKQDIMQILAAAKTPEAEKATIDTLKDLRRRIEARLQERQRELNYPAVFKMDVPGPLESGI